MFVGNPAVVGLGGLLRLVGRLDLRRVLAQLLDLVPQLDDDRFLLVELALEELDGVGALAQCGAATDGALGSI